MLRHFQKLDGSETLDSLRFHLGLLRGALLCSVLFLLLLFLLWLLSLAQSSASGGSLTALSQALWLRCGLSRSRASFVSGGLPSSAIRFSFGVFPLVPVGSLPLCRVSFRLVRCVSVCRLAGLVCGWFVSVRARASAPANFFCVVNPSDANEEMSEVNEFADVDHAPPTAAQALRKTDRSPMNHQRLTNSRIPRQLRPRPSPDSFWLRFQVIAAPSGVPALNKG